MSRLTPEERRTLANAATGILATGSYNMLVPAHTILDLCDEITVLSHERDRLRRDVERAEEPLPEVEYQHVPVRCCTADAMVEAMAAQGAE